jgi:hypothetical protein
MPRPPTRLAVLGFVWIGLAGCFGPSPNLTEGGLAKPVVTADFPSRVSVGSTTEMTVGIENPGPGDISSFSIAFAVVAVGGSQGNAKPLVLPAPAPARLGGDQKISSSVASISPEPTAVGQGGVVFQFGPLGEEESTEVVFEIIAPAEEGNYANSLQVYDSQALDRIGAIKVQTEVSG